MIPENVNPMDRDLYDLFEKKMADYATNEFCGDNLLEGLRHLKLLMTQRDCFEEAPQLLPGNAPEGERFTQCVTLARWLRARGWKYREIVELLNDHDQRTRTGQRWTLGAIGRYLTGVAA